MVDIFTTANSGAIHFIIAGKWPDNQSCAANPGGLFTL
jgi:hypothetical protein